MSLPAALFLALALAASEDPAERIERAHELASAGAGAVEELVDLLDDPDDVVRATAAASLGRIGEPARSAAPALRALLADRAARCAAAKALARILPGDPEVARAILPLLADDSDVAREEAVRALAILGGAAVRPLLEVRADTKRPKLLRDEAARALARIGDRAVPALAAALGAGDRGIRWAAILLAADLGPTAAPAKEALAAIAGGEDAWNAVWARAALVLVTGETEPHLSAIRTALADDALGPAAIQAIVRLGPRAGAALPDLLAMLDSEDRDRRWGAAVALGELGAAGRPALDELRRRDLRSVDPDPYVRDAIREAIRKLEVK